MDPSKVMFWVITSFRISMIDLTRTRRTHRRSVAGVALVAGIDSSTQSCKVVICDADTGEIVRSASSPHPDGTEVDPQLWWSALQASHLRCGGP